MLVKRPEKSSHVDTVEGVGDAGAVDGALPLAAPAVQFPCVV